VDLALNLLCESSGEKLARRAHFGSDAPLIQHGLLHLIADPNQVQPPLLAHSIKLDEQIVRFLLATLAWTPGWRPSAKSSSRSSQSTKATIRRDG